MQSNNICKFPSSAISNELSISCFVFETDLDTMRSKVTLGRTRMILVEQGSGTFEFDGVPVLFEVGTLLFGFEGETVVLTQGENVRYLYIDFGGLRANELCRRFNIAPHLRKRKDFNSLIPFCKDSLLSTPHENIDIAAESVLLYVISRLSAEHAPQNDTIQKIIEYTKENFQDPELSISTISQSIGYNSKYLSHYFKSKMNISFSEYLRSVRLKYAISLFEIGLSSVKNVALLSGFSDPFYFSNTFKKEMGISPKEFITINSKDNK